MKRIFMILFFIIISLELSSLLNREIQVGWSPFNFINNSFDIEDHAYSPKPCFFLNLEILRVDPLSLHLGFSQQKEYMKGFSANWVRGSYKYKTQYITIRTNQRPTNEKRYSFNCGLLYSKTYVTSVEEESEAEEEIYLTTERKEYIKWHPGIEFSLDVQLVKNLNLSFETGYSVKSAIGLSLKYII